MKTKAKEKNLRNCVTQIRKILKDLEAREINGVNLPPKEKDLYLKRINRYFCQIEKIDSTMACALKKELIDFNTMSPQASQGNSIGFDISYIVIKTYYYQHFISNTLCNILHDYCRWFHFLSAPS